MTNNQTLQNWYALAFGHLPEENKSYYAEWERRYNLGLDFFTAQMDSKRREAWLMITKQLLDN